VNAQFEGGSEDGKVVCADYLGQEHVVPVLIVESATAEDIRLIRIGSNGVPMARVPAIRLQYYRGKTFDHANDLLVYELVRVEDRPARWIERGFNDD
jgi:hypothetical protein